MSAKILHLVRADAQASADLVEVTHARRVRRFAASLRSLFAVGEVVLTVCDVDGDEIKEAPASTDIATFVVRAEAYGFGPRRPRSSLRAVGISDEIPRALFIHPSGGGRRAAELEALVDLQSQFVPMGGA